MHSSPFPAFLRAALEFQMEQLYECQLRRFRSAPKSLFLFSRWPFCSPTTFPVPKMPTVTTKSGRCQGNPRRMTSVKPAYQREANIYPACLNPWRRATAAPQSAFRPDRLTRPPTLLPGYTLYDTRKIFSIFDLRIIQRNMLKRGMFKKCERNIPGALLVRFNHNDHQINWRFSLSL